MGILVFIKKVGAKIFGGKSAAKKTAEAKLTELKIEEASASQHKETIKDLKLPVTDLDIHIDNGVATIKIGYDQATHEKVALAVGNSQNVTSVD